MAIIHRVIEALPERDRNELSCWAAMTDMTAEAYLEACIKKGHEIIGRQVLDTSTSTGEKNLDMPPPQKRVVGSTD
jgi:hypothetical protein